MLIVDAQMVFIWLLATDVALMHAILLVFSAQAA
jgi:hypothetical protein